MCIGSYPLHGNSIMASSIRVARADRTNPSNSRKTEERRPTEYGSALKIDNTLDGYVQLWLRLESTRQLLQGQCRRYCVRNIIRSWLHAGTLPTRHGQTMTLDDVVWMVCWKASTIETILGWNELPPPTTHPRIHRELLCALAQVMLHIGHNRVNLKALDEAYCIAFPNSTPLNVGKKKRADD